MKKKALIVFAEGFEEMEGIIPLDLLRRAGVEVTVAGLGSKEITGSRARLTVLCDALLEDVHDLFDAIILPGGMPGATNLKESEMVNVLTKTLAKSGKIVAAICATPAVVLAPLGILDGKKATCYPSMEKEFHHSTTHSREAVVIDKNIITSQGPGTAFLFGLAIVEALLGKEKRTEVERATLA
jgi:4-methyl-5(b-hydroxyethyl)-thiazole monophosphate biosynthesis